MLIIKKLKTLHELTMKSMRSRNNASFYIQSCNYHSKFNEYSLNKYKEWKLNDLLQERNCPVCNSKNTQNALNREEIDGRTYNKCINCHFLFETPAPSEKYYNEIYSSGYDGLDKWWFEQKEKHGVSEAIAYGPYPPIEWIKKRKNAGSFLDFGCGTGWILEKVKGTYDIYGIDLDDYRINYARKRLGDSEGRRILYFDESCDAKFVEKFDIIHTNQNMEHLLEPMLYLKKFYQWLKPGGLLFISCPAGDSFSISFLGNVSNVPNCGHVSLFNKKSLTYALNAIGYENIEIKYGLADVTSVDFWKKIFGIRFLQNHSFIKSPFLLLCLYPFMLMTTALLYLLHIAGILEGTTIYAFASKPNR